MEYQGGQISVNDYEPMLALLNKVNNSVEKVLVAGKDQSGRGYVHEYRVVTFEINKKVEEIFKKKLLITKKAKAKAKAKAKERACNEIIKLLGKEVNLLKDGFLSGGLVFNSKSVNELKALKELFNFDPSSNLCQITELKNIGNQLKEVMKKSREYKAGRRRIENNLNRPITKLNKDLAKGKRPTLGDMQSIKRNIKEYRKQYSQYGQSSGFSETGFIKSPVNRELIKDVLASEKKIEPSFPIIMVFLEFQEAIKGKPLTCEHWGKLRDANLKWENADKNIGTGNEVIGSLLEEIQDYIKNDLPKISQGTTVKDETQRLDFPVIALEWLGSGTLKLMLGDLSSSVGEEVQKWSAVPDVGPGAWEVFDCVIMGKTIDAKKVVDHQKELETITDYLEAPKLIIHICEQTKQEKLFQPFLERYKIFEK